MLDETLLDDPPALRRRDGAAALLSLAVSGARVRTAARLAAEAGIASLQPEGRPRHILLAGQDTAAHAADLLAALVGRVGPATVLRPTGIGDPDPGETSAIPGARRTLPVWAGPMDLLVVLSSAAGDAGLSSLARQGYRRGCSIVVVAPPHSGLATAAPELHALHLPYAGPGPAETAAAPDDPTAAALALPGREPAALWAHLTPLLLLADRLGLLAAPAEALDAVADRLDTVATQCGPEASTYLNPAKALAARLDEALPLIWSEGPAAGAVAARFAAVLAEHAGIPALTAELPEALAAHRGLLAAATGTGTDAEEDFFRDRVDEPEHLLPHVVLVRLGIDAAAEPDDGRAPGHPVAAARRLAEEYRVTVTEPDTAAPDSLDAPSAPEPPGGTEADPAAERPADPADPDARAAADPALPLRTLAAHLATLEFTAVYLRLASART